MTLLRSDLDDLRVRIADADSPHELRDLAAELHHELECARISDEEVTTALSRLAEEVTTQRAVAERACRRERDARLLLAGLVAAAKAAMAAYRDEQPEAARAILGHELFAHGWEPPAGTHAPQILADAATALHDAGLTRTEQAA